jgi:hypothetical protein
MWTNFWCRVVLGIGRRVDRSTGRRNRRRLLLKEGIRDIMQSSFGTRICTFTGMVLKH